MDDSRIRYRFLDGMRGISALCVLFYHSIRMFSGDGTSLRHLAAVNGYLAVDFFFILSGFVIANADEQKLASHSMGMQEFVARRLTRLMPLAAVGAVFGSAMLLLKARYSGALSDSVNQVISYGLINMFLIPKWWLTPGTQDDLFPADQALWSLLFELAINFLWASFLPRASTFVLCVVTLLAGIGLALCALHLGTINFGHHRATLAYGFFRAAYGFPVGVLLSRLGKRRVGTAQHPRLRLPFLGMALMLLVLFLPSSSLLWTLPATMILLPVAVWFGAMARGANLVPSSEFLGQISYPLYVIHMPVMAVMIALQHRGLLTNAQALVFTVTFAPAVAFILMRFYEQPVLAWLRWNVMARRAWPKAGTSVRTAD